MASKLEVESALGHAHADKRVEILRRVGAAGSISQAAREAGVSYKAAWQALDTLSNLAGAPLVERAVGGAGGGGARLTPAGEQLLRAAGEFARMRAATMARLARAPAAASGAAALALRTSMRNQLPCTVRALRSVAGMVRVELQLAGGGVLGSRITRESAQLLGLRAGLPVLALFKATAVEVAARRKAAEGVNLLPGQATRVSRAAGGGEVALGVEGGLQVVGFAAAGAGLKKGAAVVAAVHESAVVVALAG
jgi:molybdate transport system regulatory protein